MLIRCRGASAPSRPPPLRGRVPPSLFVQTVSPANHNHGSAAHLSANHSPAPQPPRPAPSASPNTPRASLTVFSCQPIRAPFPPSGKGVGGKGKCAAATLGAILCAVRIDFGLPSKINPYPAQPATGVLGQSPKRILPTFVRTKVGPRRVGVLTMISKRPAPPSGDNKLFHTPPSGDNKLFHTPPTGARKLFHDPTGGDYKLAPTGRRTDYDN